MPRQLQLPRREIVDMAAMFTRREIATWYRVSYPAVAAALRRYGVDSPSECKFPDELVNSNWLRAARKRCGLSHIAFANALGISERRLESWMYERSVPTAYRRLVYLAVYGLRHKLIVGKIQKRHRADARLSASRD